MDLRFADTGDADGIIDFIGQYLNREHVYVRKPEMLLHDFQSGNQLNFGLLEVDGKLQGIFGYFFYNEEAIPDIGGMIWKVTEAVEKRIPLAGLAVRDFVISHVPHRFYGSPGAARSTERIYRVLGMNWIEMDHFYGLARSTELPEFVSSSDAVFMEKPVGMQLQLITSAPVLCRLAADLSGTQTPVKGSAYLVNKYLDNPYRKYDLWACTVEHGQAVVVTRDQPCQGASILRVIDYLGKPALAAEAIAAVYHARRHSVAYVDFVCSGFDGSLFRAQGFRKVDFEDESEVVPNLFEPFVGKSSRLYAQATHGFENVVMVKGNGDQDRPNFSV